MMNRTDLSAVALIVIGPSLAVLLGTLAAAWWSREEPNRARVTEPTRQEQPSARGSSGVTNIGPRLGFDGRIHLLPGLMPGIAF